MKIKLPLFEDEKAWCRLPVIAGPCSAESREQVVQTAVDLSQKGVGFYRAGLWKPRTHPGNFEGVGDRGLDWLLEVKEKTGMKVGTEVATPSHVKSALSAGIDFIWIGARTSVNPFAVTEIADAVASIYPDITVLIKNPVNPDIELWIGALQRFEKAGVRRIGAVHRGFSGYGTTDYRNNPLWTIPIELRRRYPDLPILCDPSHIGGKRELIDSLSQRALSIGFDGLIIESHCNPDEALSDSAQQITPDVLGDLMTNWSFRQLEGNHETGLEEFRREIDEIDNELIQLLARRMAVSRQIGDYKQKNGLSVVQIGRHDQVVRTRTNLGMAKGMSGEFMEKLFRLIHEESVDQQIKPPLPDNC